MPCPCQFSCTQFQVQQHVIRTQVNNLDKSFRTQYSGTFWELKCSAKLYLFTEHSTSVNQCIASSNSLARTELDRDHVTAAGTDAAAERRFIRPLAVNAATPLLNLLLKLKLWITETKACGQSVVDGRSYRDGRPSYAILHCVSIKSVLANFGCNFFK